MKLSIMHCDYTVCLHPQLCPVPKLHCPLALTHTRQQLHKTASLTVSTDNKIYHSPFQKLTDPYIISSFFLINIKMKEGNININND